MLNKTEIFSKELDLIQDTNIKNTTENIIRLLPDYFFTVPASSTGKYHPDYALGKGGLVRHTKAAVGIAKELLVLEMYAPLRAHKDYIIAALILHDGLKHGLPYNKYSVSDHPVQMAHFIHTRSINKDIADKIASLVISHMGQWNTDYKTKEVIMPKPETDVHKFVHLCDYLASRKCLEYNFTADIPREKREEGKLKNWILIVLLAFLFLAAGFCIYISGATVKQICFILSGCIWLRMALNLLMDYIMEVFNDKDM